MNARTRLLLLAALVLLVGIPLFLAGVDLFAPGLVDSRLRILEESLATCPPDELCFEQYYGSKGVMGGTVNFTKRTLEGGDSAGFGDGAYYNISLGYRRPPLTGEQISQIKKLLGALPPPNSTTTDLISYRSQFHLAFHQGGVLRIYHYSPGEAERQLESLCKALQVPSHFPQTVASQR